MASPGTPDHNERERSMFRVRRSPSLVVSVIVLVVAVGGAAVG
jgi:hypothetical protein